MLKLPVLSDVQHCASLRNEFWWDLVFNEILNIVNTQLRAATLF